LKILITGGAGFIGSWLAKALLKESHEIVIVDNFNTGSRDSVPDDAQLLELDISQETATAQLPNDIDIVFHLASQASGEVSYEQPYYDLRTNSLGTLALLRWAKSNKVKHFIFSSTMGVYEDGHKTPRTESSAMVPNSIYGINKLAAEHYVRLFAEEGLNTTVLRFFNVYGPGQNMANLKQGMVSIYMAYIAKGMPILVKGDLKRFRDFTYVSDVIAALKLVMKNSASRGKTYNVCTGKPSTVSELLSQVKASFNESDDYPVDNTGTTPKDIFGIYGSYDAIHSELGWSPEFSLSDGVAEMAKWVKENQQ
jgi:UDP-glucose 4-epimerase